MTDGIFKNVKKIGKVIDASVSLKKLISSKIFSINARDRNIINVLNNVIVKTFPRYIWYVLKIMRFED
tara:strand:+ start:201 stop:404 length:204 start_codon:yes stop_codon:yes gene_type:complete